MRIKGTCSIVTGAASGIGKEVARLIVRKEGKVIVGDIDVENGNLLVEELNRTGNNAVFVKCDVNKLEELKNLFKVATEKFGGAQILFNNAGVFEPLGTLEQPELATKLTNILFTSVIQGCILAHNHFSEQLKSHPDREFCIINTSSIAAFEAVRTVPLYSICKRGVMDTTRILSQSGWENCRINAVGPGITRTKILKIDGGADMTKILEDDFGMLEPDYMASVMVHLVENSKLDGVVRFVDIEGCFDEKPLIFGKL